MKFLKMLALLIIVLTTVGCKANVSNETTKLNADGEIGSLVYYNSKLYSMPKDILIDYQWDGVELDTIDKIVDKTEIPTENCTTNDENLLNTVIVSVQDNYIIIKGIDYKILIEVK